MSFTQFSLDERLLHTVQVAGYTEPTPIQKAAIPVALTGVDMIGTAQTGTGKTAAFVLPILQKLLRGPRNIHRALIVTPTRELAEQINDTVKALAKGTGLRSATIYGGVSMLPQEQALRSGVEILVACPGRLQDHIDRGTARLGGIEALVLDEADRMFDMGFLPAVRRLLSHLPKARQTMLFSATFPPDVEALASAALSKPQRVSVNLSAPASTVSHAIYPVPSHLKTKMTMAMLEDLVEDAQSILIFTRTKHRANRLMQQIGREGYKVTVLHSNKSQNQRLAALDGFKKGLFQIMVATDIAARGIDVQSITHVINYDIPDTVDAYIHRIGRTGRAEREGDAMTLVTDEDRATVKAIEKVMGRPLERKQLDGFDYNAAAPAPEPVVQPQRPPRQGRPQAQRDSAPRSQQPKRDSAPRSPQAQRDSAPRSQQPKRQGSARGQRSQGGARPSGSRNAS
ncbi:DEAD/DEAH box helicase [Chloroflexia bacterium SDU3-3]|nr:DEAD/DEAH box helicase [Chloroflexia bacterium SDU3-3]